MVPMKNNTSSNVFSGNSSGRTLGYVHASFAFLTWGVVPIYWKQLKSVPPLEVLGHRIVFAAVFLFLYYCFFSSKQFQKSFVSLKQSPKKILPIVLTALLILFNWYLYIWAVNHGHIVEGSLGYFLNPLLNVFLGILLLNEKVSFTHWLAILCASVAVFILFYFQVGKPWISIGLALSFALYGYVKKVFMHSDDTVFSQFLEALFILPFVLAYFFYLSFPSTGGIALQFFSLNLFEQFLLVCAGPLTILPLISFSRAVKLLPLSVVGLFQYIAPSLQLLVGVWLYDEEFSVVHGLCFSLIWFGLAIFTFWNFYQHRLKNKQRIYS